MLNPYIRGEEKMETTEITTSIVEKLVTVCRDREAFWRLMGGLDPRTRVAVHDQLWDILVEMARSKSLNLNRRQITSRMQTSAEYQRRMGCTEPVYVCRRKTCVNSNPNCVTQKVSEHVEVIRQHLATQ
jgi:hypothetical protein